MIFSGPYKTGEVEPECVADQNACVQIRRIDPAIPEAPREIAARRVDGFPARMPLARGPRSKGFAQARAPCGWSCMARSDA